jgi:hypothetical protein
MDTTQRTARPARSGLLLATIAMLTFGGCSAQASPSPAASSNIAAASAASVATAIPSVAAALPSAVAPTAAPTPTATPAPTPLLSVAAAPSGQWNHLTWITAAGAVPLGPTYVTVHGWTGGYVAFDQAGGADGNGNVTPIIMRASASTDGLHWSAPSVLDASNLDNNVEIANIVEGPSGLLAVGFPFGDTCGGPPVVAALWSSVDGRTWDRVPLPKDFRTGQVHQISGGSAGFLATGSRADATIAAIWTSRDGRAWSSRPLPKVSSGTLVLDGATSFAGGFILAGAVLGEGQCGGPAHLHPATWWSADGAAWSRETLPGALTTPDAALSVQRLNDRVVVATQSTGDGSKLLAWASTDGRTWTAVHSPSKQLTLGPVEDGRHAVLMIGPNSGSGRSTVISIGGDARVATLSQGGSTPTETDYVPGWTFAVGPTGILVLTEDAATLWLGLPS